MTAGRSMALRRALRRAVGWAAAMLLLTACGAPEPLTVTDARIRALIPGQDKTAGYFTIRNASETDRVLTGASSPGIRAIEMHTTFREGNVARMRRLEEVVIPAGEAVRFEPGGRHLMMFGVSDLGDDLEIVLETRDGQRLPVRFETIAIGGR